jgi:fatty acid desaturase
LPLAVALAWVWSGLFAPFHECTHRTAFRTPRGNRLGAWLSGIPFGMAPLVYRVFHYEHHRHTQDVERDPELTNPAYAHWPDTPRGWLIANSGYGLIRLKLDPLLGFALKPRAEWPRFAPWSARIDDPDRVVFECRVLLGIWIAFLAGTLWLPGGIWFWFAAWFTHVFQTLWVATEHTGLPHEGSILARTRSVTSTPFVRWWLWNMNYHAEHHGWPAVPWHQLPATHALVSNHLESLVPGYSELQLGVLAGRKLPRGDP